MDLEPKELALQLAQAADDKKAQDIRILEVTDITVLADYFVICTGTSGTHLRTISDEMEQKMKEADVRPSHVEGRHAGNWLLLDFGSVVVHLFLRETRDYYSLERLWGDAKPIELPQKIQSRG